MLALYLLYFTLIRINVTSRLLVKKDTKQKQQKYWYQSIEKAAKVIQQVVPFWLKRETKVNVKNKICTKEEKTKLGYSPGSK